MNTADSLRVGAALEHIGYQPVHLPQDADVIVLNTCVVRQSAEDKAIGRLTSLKAVKKQNPDVVINLMGCLVGITDPSDLRMKFPYVDVFSKPSDPQPLVAYLTGRDRGMFDRQHLAASLLQDEETGYALPPSGSGQLVSAFLPIIYGCSHACSYCIIPLRRGREASRPPDQILSDARTMVAQGVKEITLLGQIVDRYGQDLPGYPTLSELITRLHALEGLQRIRFLTSHPNWMTEDLLDNVAGLPKVMPHFELPIQAGDDAILAAMRRGYTVEKFLRIVEKIRRCFNTVSIATDLIVGFPGETDDQFQRSVELLQTLQPDMTHVARYSPRPGTPAFLNLADDVPEAEKMQRFRTIEKLQEAITTQINSHYLNQQVPVLFEARSKSRWRGRTPTNKLVFAESAENLLGQERLVSITWTGPWSMIGTV